MDSRTCSPKIAQIAEVQDADIGPALQLLHGIDAVHPRLGIGDHNAGRQEFAELGSGQEPLLHQHLDPRRRGQVTELVVGPLRQDQVHFLQRIQHREAIRDHRGVVVLLEKDRAEMEEIVEGL